MEELPYLRLPKDFTYLLRQDMQGSSETFKSLESYIHKRSGLFTLVSRLFSDLNVGVNIKKIINALGWHGFRERLAAGYLEFVHEGQYPKNANMSFVQDIILFEETFKDFTVQGYSRAFLFAYYLKMYQISENSMPGILEIKSICKDAEIKEVLKLTQSKIMKFDWVLFQVLHLKSFLGVEKLLEHLRDNTDYETIYNELDYTDRDIFLNNALSYGASINEKKIFSEMPV